MPTRIETDFSIGYVADRLAAFTTGGESEPRTVGWHISSLIRASKELAKGKPIDPHYYYCSEDSPDMDGIADEIPEGILDWGNIWEAACRPALAEWCKYRFGFVATGPTQINKDGIIANADALVLSSQDGSVVAVAECKFKFSSNTDPLNNDDWIKQIKGYCHMWGTHMVFMPIGNVRHGPPGGKSSMYIITFDDNEIDENWRMITNTRDYMNKLLIESGPAACINHPFSHMAVGSEQSACTVHPPASGHALMANTVCTACGLLACAACADHLQQLAKYALEGVSPSSISLSPTDVDDLPF